MFQTQQNREFVVINTINTIYIRKVRIKTNHLQTKNMSFNRITFICHKCALMVSTQQIFRNFCFIVLLLFLGFYVFVQNTLFVTQF